MNCLSLHFCFSAFSEIRQVVLLPPSLHPIGTTQKDKVDVQVRDKNQLRGTRKQWINVTLRVFYMVPQRLGEA
jgi:hypothetical protein